MLTAETRIKIPALVNVHTHLREGDIVPELIRRCLEGGATVLGAMPNTQKGLLTAAEVVAYVKTAKAGAIPGYFPAWNPKREFGIIPFLMLTEKTTRQEIDECIKHGIFDAKIYPFNRTTKSHNGVVSYGRLIPLIEHCGDVGMKVHFHPEHPNALYSNRDAEFVFLPIIEMFLQMTKAIVVWEHGTDARCIPFWKEFAGSGRFFLTLTAHHLLTTEDDTFGDVRATCKPPIKLESDRVGLVQLVTEDHSWVMAGGDDAFHDKSSKHTDSGKCSCGAYTGPFLLPLYAHALDHLLQTKPGIRVFSNFTSGNACRLHNLAVPSVLVTMVRKDWQVPLEYSLGNQTALPFWAGNNVKWHIV